MRSRCGEDAPGNSQRFEQGWDVAGGTELVCADCLEPTDLEWPLTTRWRDGDPQTRCAPVECQGGLTVAEIAAKTREAARVLNELAAMMAPDDPMRRSTEILAAVLAARALSRRSRGAGA